METKNANSISKRENSLSSTLRMLSLSRLSSRSKSKDETREEKKTRRKSLTNYIRQSLQIATNSPSSASIQSDQNQQQPVEATNPYENDDQNKIVYDRLRNNNESALRLNNDNVFEPDPDYWDLPYNNNLNNFKNEYTSGSSYNEDDTKDHQRQRQHGATKSQSMTNCEENVSNGGAHTSNQISDQPVKKAISLAEVIVKSISTNSSNSSMSNLAAMSRKSKQQKHDQLLLPNKLPVTKILKKNINHSFSSNNSASSSGASTSSNNEEIIIQETVQIEVQQEEKSFRKILQSPPNSSSTCGQQSQYAEVNKIENYSSNIYSSLDDENKEAKFNYTDDKKNVILTTFQITGITIGNESDEKEAAQNLLKLTSLNNMAAAIPPPPPPSFPPPPPPPPPHLTKLAKEASPLITLNTETLMLAKQKLKTSSDIVNTIKPPLPEKKSISTETNIKSKLVKNDSRSKKNEFLLQEIQNHRLYNTKKDYVLDFLDRNKTNSTMITSNNNNNAASMATNESNLKFARSLSGTNMVLLANKSNLVENSPTTNLITVEQSSRPPPAPPIVANYERFPNARSRKNQLNQIQSQPSIANRAQSTNNRISTPNLNEIQPCIEQTNSKSASVENLNKNKKCIVIIRTKHENDYLKNPNRLSNKVENEIKAVQRSSSAAPQNSNKLKIQVVNNNNNVNSNILSISDSINSKKNLFETQIEIKHSNNSSTDEVIQQDSSTNQSCLNKKFKQLQPPEKMESELDRVFKVNFNN